MDGPRVFIAVDNCSAVDVGGLRRGTRSLPVQKPQFSEAFPGATRSSEKVRTSYRCEVKKWVCNGPSSTQHIELERWGAPLVDADRHALCQAISKGVKGKSGKSGFVATENLARREVKSRVRVKKAKAFWAMKAARGVRNLTIRLAKDLPESTKTRLELWEDVKDLVTALAAWTVHCPSMRKPFSHLGRAVTERGVRWED